MAKMNAGDREHTLKCWPTYHDQLIAGIKPFEIRLNDRDYAVGDKLRLLRFDPRRGYVAPGGGYVDHANQAHEVTATVTCVLAGFVGLKPEYVALGLKEVVDCGSFKVS